MRIAIFLPHHHSCSYTISVPYQTGSNCRCPPTRPLPLLFSLSRPLPSSLFVECTLRSIRFVYPLSNIIRTASTDASFNALFIPHTSATSAETTSILVSQQHTPGTVSTVVPKKATLDVDVDENRRSSSHRLVGGRLRREVPGLTPQVRLSLLPHMIPDSKMPRMINMEPYVFPSEAEIILLGLTSVYLKGLPCYSAHSTPRDVTKMVRPINFCESPSK